MEQNMQTRAGGAASWHLLNRYYLLTVVINLCIGVMQQLYNNTLALHIESLGYSTTVSGTLLSLGAFSALLYRVFGGRVAERFGRRATLLLGLAVMAVTNLLCGLAGNLPLLFLFSIVKMVSFSMAGTSVAVMVVDVVPRERMTEGIGYFGLGMSLAQAVGPTMAVAVYGGSAFVGVMGLAAVVGLVSTLLVLFFGSYERRASFPGNRLEALAQQPVRQPRRSVREWFWSLVERSALRATGVALCGSLSFCVITMYLTHYATMRGIANPGGYFFCSAVAMVLSRLISGRLADRKGTLFCVLPGFGMVLCALLFLPLAPHSQALFYLSGVLNGFGQGMATPALNAAAVHAAPPERRSAASSTFLLQNDLSVMGGSFVWGLLIDALGYDAVFRVAALVLGLGLVLAIWLLRRKKAAPRD